MTDIQQVAEHLEVLVPLNDNKAKLLDERIRRMADTARGDLEIQSAISSMRPGTARSTSPSASSRGPRM